ncbi:MAG: tetratricopeptide repeat protein [Cellulosilyticaceae bacterium]
MKILFVTADWMKYYVGEGDEEKVVPLCGYNYQYMNGKYYGYAECLEGLDITAFEGASAQDTEVNDVLVVWLAKNRDGDKCVIGWYKNATVYRETKKELTLDSERYEMIYRITAPAKDALLLPVEERRYAVNHIEADVHIEQGGLVGGQVMTYIHQYQGDHMNLVLTKEEIQKAMTINLNYEQYFYKADEFLARDSYAKAMKCFNKAIQEEPMETLGYECKGSVLLSLKMYDEAIEAYEAVVERDEDNDLAYYCLGLLHGLKKQYDKALTYIDQYLVRRPGDTNALAERGLIYIELGERERGLQEVERALKEDPSNEMIQKMKNILN